MYNGIGLQTARGSGTNGYVQTNLANLLLSKKRVAYNSEADIKRCEAELNRKPNLELIEHNKKRRIELKCADFEMLMENKGFDEAEIVEKVDEYRKLLQSQVESGELNIDDESKNMDTHTRAVAATESRNRMRAALGIKDDFVDGSSFSQQEGKTKRRKKSVSSSSSSSESSEESDESTSSNSESDSEGSDGSSSSGSESPAQLLRDNSNKSAKHSVETGSGKIIDQKKKESNQNNEKERSRGSDKRYSREPKSQQDHDDRREIDRNHRNFDDSRNHSYNQRQSNYRRERSRYDRSRAVDERRHERSRYADDDKHSRRRRYEDHEEIDRERKRERDHRKQTENSNSQTKRRKRHDTSDSSAESDAKSTK